MQVFVQDSKVCAKFPQDLQSTCVYPVVWLILVASCVVDGWIVTCISQVMQVTDAAQFIINLMQPTTFPDCFLH